MRIFIDPGHNFSGADTGAHGNGLREQDITFVISKKLKKMFVDNGDEVMMSRNTLQDNVGKSLMESLRKRCEMANEWNADLFLSIHCNAHNGIAKGTEAFVYSMPSEAYSIATEIQKNIVERLNTENRNVKIGKDLYVLKNTNCPAVLVETAFIDNEEDAEKLLKNPNDFAQAVFDGVVRSQKAKKENIIEDITSVNDIVWELSHRGIITDKDLWLFKLDNDENAYWLARKCVNYIRRAKK